MLLAFRDKRWAFVDNITAFPVIDFARRESFPARRAESNALPNADFAQPESFSAFPAKSTALPGVNFARRESFCAHREKTTALLRKRKESINDDKIQPEIL